MSDYQKLEVWRRAHSLALNVYRVTAAFPRSEMFGLTSQLRRAASSVGANIAEGSGRKSDRDFRRFLTIALGSNSEVDYHLLLAADLKFMDAGSATKLRAENAEIGKMLSRLVDRVSSRAASAV